MVTSRLMGALLCVVVAASGCATSSGGGTSQTTCTVIGGVLGAGAGVAGGGANHDDDEPRQAAGGVLGALAGAALGSLLCAPPVAGKMGPKVRANANPGSGTAPLSTRLSAVGSDSDGSIVSYAWDFGDGTTGSGANPQHTYAEPGRYTATVTATDNDGLTATTSVPVVVNAAQAARSPARRIVLRGVNFDFDKADIRPDAQVILDAAAEVLSENSGVRVQVGGHTDATGPDAYNQSLSERRAAAVRQYLTSNGISGGRLSTAGFGESNPVATNATSDGRAQNRRVELKILE